MSDQKKSDAPNTTFITLQVPVDLLEKFIEHRKDAEREHQLMQEEIYRANDTIYSAFEDVERCHRDCEEAIEQMEEVAGDIKKALMQQLATAGVANLSDLRKSRPDLVEFIESWEYVGQVGELDFSTEIDEPRLELDLPFVQVETPAEKELRAQIKQMQASLVTLQGCRRPGGLGK